MSAIRLLEILFFLYFASHIPITLFIDLQTVLPDYIYPQTLKDVVHVYAEKLNDPMVLDPPEWFRSFIVCEALFQTPFFPVAAYAFFKGGCQWIRTAAIVYSSHVATTLVPILSHILFHEFPVDGPRGPQTPRERWMLASIYFPYLLVPVLLLCTMLLSSTYNPNEASVKKAKKKN
ncbi:glucocorticoid modulatory element-binding protein 1 isoform X4 [Entelurus aequoreus]|uniref:glucocorticoid modulatory element-binding protein 1 isoform X4 n=1 Tax=Entelurus aequoreus TaxID=161455 RepID=UPI002B1D715F|nr:glucocorticoid modulatory element-binding protein 1 isoform X4 [Entelurus aequoreus]